jgi:hypothetical protein
VPSELVFARILVDMAGDDDGSDDSNNRRPFSGKVRHSQAEACRVMVDHPELEQQKGTPAARDALGKRV